MIRCEVSGPNGPTIGPRWPAFGGESRPPSETTSFLPIITLAIIFGLSSDYEMFVVSRIKEDYTKHGDALRAVPRGAARHREVGPRGHRRRADHVLHLRGLRDRVQPTIKAFGFTFAVGVFPDTSVVRLTVVPAVMSIIGSRIWYHPQ